MKYTPEETNSIFELIKENPAGFYSLVSKHCPPERLYEVKRGLLSIGVPEEKIYVNKNYTSGWPTRKRKKY